jgi:anti-sigma B factor antagonist
MDPTYFVCEVQADDRRADVRMVGELDLEAAGGAAMLVDELIVGGAAHVVLDLRELSFMDSAGVHMLVSARRSAEQRECAFSLVRGARRVHRVLELTATEPLFRFINAPREG